MSANSAVALLRELRRRHVLLEARNDRLRVRAPRGAVADRDRDALRACKTEILQRLVREEELLGLSLDEFARANYSIELTVPWLDETIWFVSRLDHVQDLVNDGVHRGRIWTARELKDLASIPRLADRDLVALSRLKLAFGGEVLSVAAKVSSS